MIDNERSFAIVPRHEHRRQPHPAVRRLGNAGVEIALGDESLVIDLFEDNSPLEPFVGPVHTELPAPSAGAPVPRSSPTCTPTTPTPKAIAAAIADGAPVLRPAPARGRGWRSPGSRSPRRASRELGLAQRAMAPWEQRQSARSRSPLCRPSTASATRRSPGSSRRAAFASSTAATRIFHGWWWPIRDRCGAIDLALLPINGPTVEPARTASPPTRSRPHWIRRRRPRRRTSSARGSRSAIHYDAFNHEPTYVQVEAPAERFAEEAEALGVSTQIVAPGAHVDQQLEPA